MPSTVGRRARHPPPLRPFDGYIGVQDPRQPPHATENIYREIIITAQGYMAQRCIMGHANEEPHPNNSNGPH